MGGNGRRGPEYYAGKYIVFNTRVATIRSLEPHAIRPRYDGQELINPDALVYDPVTRNIYSEINLSVDTDPLPFMRERWGQDSGDMLNTQTSFYLNDMWTINEHHSVMAGLRVDSFKLEDSVRAVHSYIKPTLRFEYKYDMFGDQKHLFAASLGQFHQMSAMNAYLPFVEKKFGNTSVMMWTGDNITDTRRNQKGYYVVDWNELSDRGNYTLEKSLELSGSQFGNIDKNFRPPTSTEFSLWYRHTFPSGGSIKVSFNNRSWADLYDLFPSEVFEYENPNTHAKSNMIKATLKNCDEWYSRSYNGLELQWDFPITRKVSFGGNYTYSRYLSNQTGYGSSNTAVQGTDNYATGQTLQTPWWFNEAFSRDVVGANGEVLYNFGGRNAWAPMQNQASEFNLGYYLIVNLTQGKARSNFTLRGSYAGSSTNYDRGNIQIGRAIIPGYNTYPGAGANQLDNYRMAYFNQYTGYDTFQNHFTYNLNMPLAKRLSWFLNLNISNIFNHVPRTPYVPAGQNAEATQPIIPWDIQNSATSTTASNWSTASIWNPFRDGWTWTAGNLSRNFVSRSPQLRTISMSTGIRF
jgi:hypothetical protein